MEGGGILGGLRVYFYFADVFLELKKKNKNTCTYCDYVAEDKEKRKSHESSGNTNMNIRNYG